MAAMCCLGVVFVLLVVRGGARRGRLCNSVVYLAAAFVDSEIITNPSPISRRSFRGFYELAFYQRSEFPSERVIVCDPNFAKVSPAFKYLSPLSRLTRERSSRTRALKLAKVSAESLREHLLEGIPACECTFESVFT